MRSWVQLDPGYMPVCNGYNGIPNSDCLPKEEDKDDGAVDNRLEKPNIKEEEENAPKVQAAKSFIQYDPNENPLPYCNKYNGNYCRERPPMEEKKEATPGEEEEAGSANSPPPELQAASTTGTSVQNVPSPQAPAASFVSIDGQ
jgi:hypothetical protein